MSENIDFKSIKARLDKIQKADDMSEKDRVIVIDEKMSFGILRGVIEMGLLVLSFWACYEYLHGSILFQIILTVIFFAWLVAKSDKYARRMSGPEALAYLKKKYEKGSGA